jgi:tetratricopeptide (TPR) repeat protein
VACAFGALVAGGCDRFAARVEFKKGNADYKNESYRTAIENYRKGLDLDPSAKQVWRSLGLAAMAVYRPGDDSAANVEYAKQAVTAFSNYLQAFPNDEKVREYLLTTLLNSEQYDAALTRLEEAARANPSDARLEEGIVSVLLKAKRLDDASARVARAGAKATFSMNYSVGVFCWDKAYRDPLLDQEARLKVVETGVAALKRAVEQQPEAFESNVYYNLILREKAKLELDPEKQQALIAEAMTYQEKAKAIAKTKKAAPAA